VHEYTYTQRAHDRGTCTFYIEINTTARAGGVIQAAVTSGGLDARTRKGAEVDACTNEASSSSVGCLRRADGRASAGFERRRRDGDGGCCAVLPPLHVGVIYGITDTAAAAAVDGQNITVSVGVVRREKRRSGSLALLRGAIKSAQQCRPPCRLPW